MMSYRSERLAEAIKKEVSELLREEIKDPRIGFVSITAVRVSKDFRYADIFASVFGEAAEQKAAMAALAKARGFVRSELGKRIRLRHIPEINFKLDESIE
ncbi:MAG: 30S ribosome-binding factor RbfA, partial [Peptococcaceae bacterium]|nr:30S ribosome-binding factor RbfA [Peptococcaceae bacterium]